MTENWCYAEKLSLVFTVLVNWNQADETQACIGTLLAAGVPPHSIIVVDNGSDDNSLASLRAHLDNRVQLLESKINLGFAGGTNLGIRAALTRNARWVMLMNNDTRVAPTFYTELLSAAKMHPDYALLSPLILYFDKPNSIWSLGDRLIPGTLITRSLQRNRPSSQDLADFIPVDFLNACCLLIQREVFERIGLLDTAYFMYSEDVDFCWRARRAGFRLACVTKARIWHKVSWSTGPTHPQNRHWRISNQIRFYRQAANGPQKILMWTFTLMRSLWLAARDLLHARGSLAIVTLSAWWEGWNTPSGE